MKNIPLLFIGHGSPQNMLLDNSFTQSLKTAGKALPKVQAALVISAHWLTKGTFLSCALESSLVYDFYGFSPELYKVEYPCLGSPTLARRVQELLSPKHKVFLDTSGRLDHAVYSVLKHLYPDANVPVVSMSLDVTLNAQQHYDLAADLAQLRREGILIVASGNLIHNLSKIDFRTEAPPYIWAQEIDNLFKQKLEQNDHKFFINFPDSDERSLLALPTPDHYLPLLYALSLKEKSEDLNFICEDLQNASISMRSFEIG